MPFFLLAIVSAVSAFGVFTYTQSHGGGDAAAVVSGHVLDGPMLYAIAALLFVGALLFVIAAVAKAIRRVVAMLAALSIAAGGGIGTFVPKDLAKYQHEHACKIVHQQCDK